MLPSMSVEERSLYCLEITSSVTNGETLAVLSCWEGRYYCLSSVNQCVSVLMYAEEK